MKTFSLGFILTFIFSSWLSHISLKIIKEFFDNMIIIIPSTLFAIFVFWQLIKLIQIKCSHRELSNGIDIDWKCLLIDGVWGSGKTTHYQKYYQYIDKEPNIYISCFSASRSELIAQIIQQRFLCKLLTLNGSLAKFMESNWQVFMPKKRVVVFDDLERLHANQDNYLDLIGIIDYLKDKNECKIILICNMQELKEPIFNTYMERIVDKHEYPTLLSKNQFKDKLIENPDLLTQQLLDKLYAKYKDGEINNLRIIKNIAPKIIEKLNDDYSEFNEVEQILNGSVNEIMKMINKHYLFYANNELFRKCVDLQNPKTLSFETDVIDKEKIDLQKSLNSYNLLVDMFNCAAYKTWRDLDKVLDPDFSDFLALDIEYNLSLGDDVINDDSERIQNLICTYLDKYLSNETKNNFNNGNYVLSLLYVVWHAGNIEDEKRRDFFTRILESFRFMSGDNTPLKIDGFSWLTFYKPDNLNLYMKLFGIEEFRENEFLNEYFDFYRNKVIGKFISSVEKIDYDTLQYFGNNWFKNKYSNENYNFIKEGSGYYSLNDLYELVNKCVNNVIIQKWIESSIMKSMLAQYYKTVIYEINKCINDSSKPYIKTDLDKLINIVSDNDNATDVLLLMNQLSSFSEMRDKLFRFKNIVENYMKDDEGQLTLFNQCNEENAEIIEKLFVEK